MSTLKIAINGFGRIGRLVLRAAINNSNIEFVGINDLVPAENLAYLLKYDSTHGQFPGNVEFQDNGISINGKYIPCMAVRDPAELPWAELGVDYVIESTGLFTTQEGAQKHLQAEQSGSFFQPPPSLQSKLRPFWSALIMKPLIKSAIALYPMPAAPQIALPPLPKSFRITSG